MEPELALWAAEIHHCSPAIGRAMAELILDGRFVTLDLSRMTYRRVIDDEPLHETAIV